jgi:uncharacterized alkaline shock family protein YloU
MTGSAKHSGGAPAGRIEVLPRAIAAIAARAAADTPGVAALARVPGATGRRRGAEVRLRGDQVVIDVYVLVQYGARIAEVASAARERVSAAVELALGQPPDEVHVRVQGLSGRAEPR